MEARRLQEETKKMLRSVLLPNKEGLLLSDLEREFQGIVGYPIPWRKLGHISLLEMVRSMPGVVIVESLGEGHILLHAAPDKSTRHIADLVSKQFDPYRKMGCGYNQHTGYVLRNLRDAPRSVIPPRMEPGEVPPGVEEELNTLLANFPSGLMASRLLVEFRLFFGKELNMGGFTTVVQLLAHLSGSIDLQQEGNLGDWRLKLLRQKQEELPWFNKQTTEDWVDLLVLRVKSPGDLCVMPRSMRKEVGRIQEEISKEVGAPLARLSPGQRVAAPGREGSLARAEVVEDGINASTGKVKVFFIDTGEQRLVNEEDLRELPQHIARKPPLVLRTGLANVAPPPQGVWGKEMCRKLKSMVQDAMAVKGSNIQGRLHQNASLPWPLLELKLKTYKGEIVHVNEILSEEFDKDVSFPRSPKEGDPLNMLDLPNKHQDNGRRQGGDVSLFAGCAAEEAPRKRTLSAQVNENFLTKDLYTSNKVIELMGQIRDKVVQRIGEGNTGQRLAVEALQRCLSSLDIAPDRPFVSLDSGSSKSRPVPEVNGSLAKSMRFSQNMKLNDRNVNEMCFGESEESTNDALEVTQCRLPLGEQEERVTVHLVRLEQGGERWCSSGEVANLLPHWGGRDLVNKMLKTRRIEMVEKVIRRQEHPEIFASLTKWGVRGVNIGEQELVLYKLEDVPLIMKAFRMAGLKEVLADLNDLIERGN